MRWVEIKYLLKSEVRVNLPGEDIQKEGDIQ